MEYMFLVFVYNSEDGNYMWEHLLGCFSSVFNNGKNVWRGQETVIMKNLPAIQISFLNYTEV